MKKSALAKLVLVGTIPVLSLSGCLAAAIPFASRAAMSPTHNVVVVETVTVEATAPAAAAHHRERLRCGNNEIQLEVIGDNLAAVINGTHRVQLHQVVSASGSKYANPTAGLTLWNHHAEWLMIVNEGTANEQSIDCASIS